MSATERGPCSASLCTGNCDACTGAGTAFSCVPVAASCSGDCAICSGNGTAFSCMPNAAACCGACVASGDAFVCEQALVVSIVQEQADDHLLSPVWQSFTVPTDGHLAAIEARPNVLGGRSGELRVYAGTGVSGSVLRSQAFVLPSRSGAPWQRFDLVDPLPVAANETLTWELAGLSDAYHSLSDVYPGGRASVATHDYVMRIYIATCP